MAFTVSNRPLNMRGGYWMQESRLTTIKYLERHVVAALKNFARNNRGAYPLKIVVYRDGVSEGEFEKVAQEEAGNGFQKAFEAMAAEDRKFTKPTLMIVVCQRGSNYRIIPERVNPQDRAPQQNVPFLLKAKNINF
jgi:eukaryotic translation initiation factor 2C